MKITFALLPVAISAAQAAVNPSRDISDFIVFNFSAACNRSGTCSWSFNLVEIPGTDVLDCKGTAEAGPGNTFPTTSHIISCSDTNVKFVFQHLADINVYRLVIDDVHTVGHTIGGSTLLDPKDFSTVDGAEVYTGDKSFAIEAF